MNVFDIVDGAAAFVMLLFMFFLSLLLVWGIKRVWKELGK